MNETKKENAATDVAVVENRNQVVATTGNTIANKFSDQQLAESDLNNGAMIPDTAKVKPLPLKLNSEQWSPEIGETKDFVLIDFGYIEYSDMDATKSAAGVKNKVYSAYLASRGQNSEGNPVLERWHVGAKRLVSTLEDAANRGFLIKNNAKVIVRITLKGKIKNKTNAFSSDNYDVELIPNY